MKLIIHSQISTVQIDALEWMINIVPQFVMDEIPIHAAIKVNPSLQQRLIHINLYGMNYTIN